MASNMKENLLQADIKEVFEPQATAAEPQKHPMRLRYFLCFLFAYWHLGALYGLYLTPSVRWPTIVLNICMYLIAGWGTTAGAHRLWSHRAFRATLPLQVLLMLEQTMSCQLCVLKWARDHRLHHKYVDTDADPYNARRGLFFSHIGWLLVEKHPEVIWRGREIDMSDLLANPVLRFQKKYYYPLALVVSFVLPAALPALLWRESWRAAYYVRLLALAAGSHVTYCVNSVAHRFGRKPYDASITPAQSTALYALTLGEGHHNYHHAFPSDYRVSELGIEYLNYSTIAIDFFARIGWAYDLRRPSPAMVALRARRTGDGTRPSDRLSERFDEDKAD